MEKLIEQKPGILELNFRTDLKNLSFSQDFKGNLIVKDRLNQRETTLHSQHHMPPKMDCYEPEQYYMMRAILRLYRDLKYVSKFSGLIFLVLLIALVGITYQSGFDDVPLWLSLAIASSFSFSLASRMAMKKCDSVVKTLYHYILYVNCLRSEPFDFGSALV